MHIYLLFDRLIFIPVIALFNLNLCMATPTTFYWAHFIENKRMWIDHEIEAFVSI